LDKPACGWPKKYKLGMNSRDKFNQIPSCDGFRVDVTDPKEFDSHDAPDGTVFQKRIGLKEYVLKRPDEATQEKWQQDVGLVLDAIKTKDLERIRTVINHPYILEHWDEILINVEKDGGPLDEEEQTLLAISLWTMDKQGQWKGLMQAGKMLVRGGEHDLRKIVEHELDAACVNSASIVEYFTEIFGIHGVVKRTGGRFSHRYWESDTGRVVDTWWGRERGGLFRSFADYMSSRNAQHDMIDIATNLV